MRNLRALLFATVALLTATPFVATAGDSAAADFSLRDVNNTLYTLSQFKGKVVLINFWATWCGPCQVEMPHLEAMYKELGPKGFVVLGVSTDDARTGSQIKPLIMSKGLTYPILRDTQTQVIAQYNPAKTLPYNVLVDRAGNVAQVHAGYNAGEEVALKAEIVALLAK